MKEKVWVKALVDPKLYIKVAGVQIILWGHVFETQADGTLCTEMNTDFVKSEVRAGRVRVLEKPPPGKSNEAMISKIDVVDTNKEDRDFALDISNYYGAGDLNTLILKISEDMTKEQMMVFADDRFKDHSLKYNMTREVMIDKIRSLVDSAYMEYTEQLELSKDDE
jgi:hypothetical protein